MFLEQGRLGRVVGAVALTTVLSLAGPARAAAAEGRIGSVDLWSRLAGWWQSGIRTLVQDLTPAAPAALALRAKDLCPPTGCPVPPPGGNNQGVGTDPDGKPH